MKHCTQESPMMIRKYLPALMGLAVLAIVLSPTALAVSVNSFTTDKSSYTGGDTGTANIVFTNDQGAKIQITTAAMAFNYYYQDGRVYTQTFSQTGLSMNVTDGSNSQTIAVKFSLPVDIAAGYFSPTVQVTFLQLLNTGSWSQPRNDNGAATSPLLVQSAQYQSAVTLQYVFIATTVLFAALAAYYAMRHQSLKKPAN